MGDPINGVDPSGLDPVVDLGQLLALYSFLSDTLYTGQFKSRYQWGKTGYLPEGQRKRLVIVLSETLDAHGKFSVCSHEGVHFLAEKFRVALGLKNNPSMALDEEILGMALGALTDTILSSSNSDIREDFASIRADLLEDAQAGSLINIKLHALSGNPGISAVGSTPPPAISPSTVLNTTRMFP